MAKKRTITGSLEDSKSRFEIIGGVWDKDYSYKTSSGEVVALSVEDLEHIHRFYEFSISRGFIIWLKYKLKGGDKSE